MYKLPKQYSLIAAVNYAGTSMNGHYQSAVLVGDKWLLLNDNSVPHLVWSQRQMKSTQLVTSFMLFSMLHEGATFLGMLPYGGMAFGVVATDLLDETANW